jgi:hypothetical protein
MPPHPSLILPQSVPCCWQVVAVGHGPLSSGPPSMKMLAPVEPPTSGSPELELVGAPPLPPLPGPELVEETPLWVALHDTKMAVPATAVATTRSVRIRPW